MNLSDIKTVHFTGIKGVGMTALACVAKDFDMQVTGSDSAEEFVTDEILKRKGIPINEGFSPELIVQSKPGLVIYTAANNGALNPEVIKAKEIGIPTFSQGEALGMFQKTKKGISVAGVGGKTTTTALLATIFEKASQNPSYLVGAGSVPSLEFPGKYAKEGDVFIAEADEYVCSPQELRPKFYYQDPQVILIPNLAFDHPDVYKNEEETLAVFSSFVNRLPKDGLLVICIDSPLSQKFVQTITTTGTVITYGESSEAFWRIENYSSNTKTLKAVSKEGEQLSLSLTLPGKFNAKNALGAVLAARYFGISQEQTQEGALLFKGLKRRFEHLKTLGSVIFYDDYAHHPEEIRATLATVRREFGGKKVVAVFQPHTFSRTKALLAEFSKSFSDADEVVITEIFPSAREQFDNSINGAMLCKEVAKYHRNVFFSGGRETTIEYLLQQKFHDSVVISMGAGDVYKWMDEVVKNNPTYD